MHDCFRYCDPHCRNSQIFFSYISRTCISCNTSIPNYNSRAMGNWLLRLPNCSLPRVPLLEFIVMICITFLMMYHPFATDIRPAILYPRYDFGPLLKEKKKVLGEQQKKVSLDVEKKNPKKDFIIMSVIKKP